MDAYLTACTGLDALTHAIEAFVSTANSPLTDLHALEAIRLLAGNLPGVINDPDNLAQRTEVMLASTYAGLAFSNAILGAVHAMAHSLGGFLDLPHGECNAILLEHVIGYNFSAARERYRAVAMAMGLPARELGHEELRQCLLEGVRNIRLGAGITHTLTELGVCKADLAELSAKACADACLLTNPRQAGPGEIEAIYEKAL
jgi:alcohol dehydrogenase class IV